MTIAWAAYYVAVFTVGRMEEYQRLVIWGGGAAAALLTAVVLRSDLARFPKEALLVASMLAWSLTAWWDVVDVSAYSYYFLLCAETLVMIALVGAVIRKSGWLEPLWWAYLVVGVYNTVAVALMGGLQVRADYGQYERAQGLLDNANGLAFLCFMGILGALALVALRKPWAVTAVVAVGAFVCFWGMLATGARGAFVAFLLAVFLWPLMCLRIRARSRWTPVVAMLLTCVALYGLADWVQANTTLGERAEQVMTGEEASAGMRVELILRGLEIAAEHPLSGVGLGQFGVASGSGLYAHNEWVELLATVGVPGFILFMGVYGLTWRRLTASLRYVSDPLVRYRINFMRLTLIVLVAAGASFRPNFISVDTMFLLGSIAGFSWWSHDAAGRASASKADPRSATSATRGSEHLLEARARVGVRR